MSSARLGERPTLTERLPRGRLRELRLEGVTRRYGGAPALDALDLKIEGGEFVALLGPSGCGKTTALNCIAGLVALTAGTIRLDGRRIDGLPAERRGFGMVFQNYALFPHLSVRRNVAFGLAMRRTPKREAQDRVARALALVNLQEHADKFPAQLSGGQQQRVSIARAVVIEPSLLLMDEPLSNLDAKLRLEMRTEIRRLHQELGLTTVYVTHDQEEALSLADRLVLLRDGKVVQEGSPEQMYSEPVNAYAAAFMGYRNMLELPVCGSDGSRATLGEGGLRLCGLDRRVGSARRAVVAVRPQDFTLGAGLSNAIRGHVAVVEYRGHQHAAEIVVPGGRRLHVLADQPLGSGEEVTVSVAPDRVLVFDCDGGQHTGEAA